MGRSAQLGLLAKYWEPGKVKTRLGAQIGTAAAARLHRVFLETLLERFGNAADRRKLAFTPAEKQTEFAALVADGTWEIENQAGGSLGARLRHCIESALREGADKVVLIGADSPALPRTLLDQAFDKLDESPVVLGPAEDGGYYLVGAAGEVPDIFSGISWGTATVWEETIARLQQKNIDYSTLRVSYDVDTRQDLLRLHQELQSTSELSAPLARLRNAVARNLFRV